MKRDMDLIRLLLLKLENISEDAYSISIIFPEDMDLPDYSADQIDYHLELLVEAGLIDQGGSGVMNGFTFRKLTWAGHDFLESVRDDEIWRKTREGALAAGGFSIDLLGDLAKGFIRKKVAALTGVDL